MFDWIIGVVAEGGYAGIILMMIAENIFPPVPSELIMPLAGFVAAQGALNPLLVVAAGTAGSMVGALPWYYLGVWLGEARLRRFLARYGRWLTLEARDLDRAMRWFDRHGTTAVVVARLLPAVRTFIALPAGVARMPLGVFLLCVAIGSTIWNGALTWAGYRLEAEYLQVARYLDHASKIMIGVIVVLYLYRVVAAGGFGVRLGYWARTLRRDVHALYLAARDPRVPWYAKTVAMLVAAYALSPIDLIPDFIPVLGHLDDMILVPLGILLAVRLIPDEVFQEHRRAAEAIAKKPVDWRVGVLFVVIWLVVLVFAARWLLGVVQ